MISILPRRPMIVAAVEHRGLQMFRRTLQARSCSATSHVAPLRRSGNYQPSLWTDERVQSLTNTSTVQQEEKRERINVLKEQTRNLIREKQQVAEQLQLIDQLQQLGVAYHFKDEIADVLSRLHASLDHVSSQLKDDLHATALLFRLLRANGFSVSQDLFETFRDENGNFEARCENQIRGLLSLYEASYLEKEGETLLKEAMDFATEQLKGFMEGGSVAEAGGLREQVARALQLPLNWRLERVQHRWFIEACSSGDDTVNPLLLEFAKLDFNLVQDMYKSDLRELSRWWSELGLPEKLPFFRDRLLENYTWALGFSYEPDSRRCRMIEAKTVSLIALYDDIYDVYGTLDELQLFTDAVNRWDLTAMDKLPEYMKLCFFAIFNLVHEEGYRVMKEKGLDIVPDFKIAHEMERGDVATCIQCYMLEKGVSEKVARRKMRELIRKYWKEVNGSLNWDSPLEEYFKNIAANIPRAAQFFYQDGDGYGKEDGETKTQIISLLLEPIQI
ncbi:hypothetical protein ZIOFF_043119 [Zingiber officinale]|uniref:Uncharacterized protein n=1 Tax=Zingiber officinale TaxID=94328 RepID=A0A8J5KYI1_ZINOF|nr:hypothetical protein ZIOFF_043119 [Zingiber officinale]